MIVVDASVLAQTLVAFSDNDIRVRRELASNELAAPAHINLEVIAVVRKYCRRNIITEQRASMALFDLRELSIERVPTESLESRIWDLRHNVSPYDAAYVALAERFGAELWTFDRKLAGVPGTECVITVPDFG